MILIEHPNVDLKRTEVIEWLRVKVMNFKADIFLQMWVNGLIKVFLNRNDAKEIVGFEAWVSILNPLNIPMSHAYCAASIGDISGIKEYRQHIFHALQIVEV